MSEARTIVASGDADGSEGGAEAPTVRPWRPPAFPPGTGRRAGDGPGRIGGVLVDAHVRDRRDRRDRRGAEAPRDEGAAHGGGAAEAVDEGDAVDVAAEAERARAQAYDAGFAAGGAAARETLADEVAALVRSFERETRIVVDALEGELAELALEAAGCVLRRRLDGDAELVRELVREGLEALAEASASAGTATVRLHPVDAALFGEGDLGSDVTVEVDPSLGRGDCRLERGPSRMDASVRARLEAVCAQRDDAPGDDAT